MLYIKVKCSSVFAIVQVYGVRFIIQICTSECVFSNGTWSLLMGDVVVDFPMY